MIITAPDGTEVECFITQQEGMIDAILRADTKEAFEQAAIAAEILEPIEMEDGTEKLVPVPGNNVDVLGPVEITPGEFDENNNELVAPLIDGRYHVNLRIAEPALSKLNDAGYPKWKATVLTWMQFGADDVSPNKNEVGKALQQVSLIDPASISTLRRVWL